MFLCVLYYLVLFLSFWVSRSLFSLLRSFLLFSPICYHFSSPFCPFSFYNSSFLSLSSFLFYICSLSSFSFFFSLFYVYYSFRIKNKRQRQATDSHRNRKKETEGDTDTDTDRNKEKDKRRRPLSARWDPYLQRAADLLQLAGKIHVEVHKTPTPTYAWQDGCASDLINPNPTKASRNVTYSTRPNFDFEALLLLFSLFFCFLLSCFYLFSFFLPFFSSFFLFLFSTSFLLLSPRRCRHPNQNPHPNRKHDRRRRWQLSFLIIRIKILFKKSGIFLHRVGKEWIAKGILENAMQSECIAWGILKNAMQSGCIAWGILNKCKVSEQHGAFCKINCKVSEAREASSKTQLSNSPLQHMNMRDMLQASLNTQLSNSPCNICKWGMRCRHP